MQTTKVIDGKLCIEQSGVKVWFTLVVIDKHIARLETELQTWRDLRLTLYAGDGATPAPCQRRRGVEKKTKPRIGPERAIGLPDMCLSCVQRNWWSAVGNGTGRPNHSMKPISTASASE